MVTSQEAFESPNYYCYYLWEFCIGNISHGNMQALEKYQHGFLSGEIVYKSHAIFLFALSTIPNGYLCYYYYIITCTIVFTVLAYTVTNFCDFHS